MKPKTTKKSSSKPIGLTLAGKRINIIPNTEEMTDVFGQILEDTEINRRRSPGDEIILFLMKRYRQDTEKGLLKELEGAAKAMFKTPGNKLPEVIRQVLLKYYGNGAKE